MRTRALLLAVSLSLHGCPKPAAGPPRTEQTYLWSVSNQSGPIAWLLGSVHFAPVGFELDTTLVTAFDEADSLAVELNTDAISTRELMRVYEQRAFLPPGQSLAGEIGQADFERLKAALSSRGIMLLNLARVRPWAVVLALHVNAPSGPSDSDVVLGMGVDRYFIARAKAGEKTIHSLETLEAQMDVFSSADPELQKRELLRALAAVEAGLSPVEEVADAYLEGRIEDALPGHTGVADEALKAYWKRLVDDRNATMAGRIEELIAGGARPLVVVGAAHMVGPVGIPTLLEKRGYSVAPVPPSGEKVAVQPPQEGGAELPDVRVVDYVIDWPVPPQTRVVDVHGNEMTVTMAQAGAVQYLLSKTSAARTVILSLDKLYEHGRLASERDMHGAIFEQRRVEVSGLRGDRFVARNALAEIRALQVWADGKLYSLVAVMPLLQTSDALRAQADAVLDSFELQTYTREEAATNRDRALALLDTRPGWLPEPQLCASELVRDASNLTPTEVNHCAPDAHACLIACGEGDALSCMRAADAFMDQGEELERVMALYWRACELGLLEGCTSQAGSLLLDDERRAVWGCAAETLELACVRGEPWGCTLYGAGLAWGRGIAEDRHAARQTLARACELGPASKACKHARQLSAKLAAAEEE
jgi:uncharacterized protein YbaP (TraB family)